MKKMFAVVTALVVAVCALSVISFTYDTAPDVVIAGGEIANAIATSSADTCTHDRQDYPVGYNTENQYDILAENDLYGHVDYGDYVPAEVRYIDGFPTVDGIKTNNYYYGSEKYIEPAEEEKPREDWNLYDFHQNGELFESIGAGSMYFNNDEDRAAYIDSLKDEYGADNVREDNYSTSSSSSTGNSMIDNAKNTVDDVNEKQDNISIIIDSMG